MKCYRDLFKKKKIKTMNNKMAINTYLSTNRSKKQMVGGLPERGRGWLEMEKGRNVKQL